MGVDAEVYMSTGAKRPVLLLADDDADDRMLVKEALEESEGQAELRCVADGEELGAYLERRGTYSEVALSPSPSLILLDLNMPKKGGLEVLGDLKSSPQFK